MESESYSGYSVWGHAILQQEDMASLYKLPEDIIVLGKTSDKASEIDGFSKNQWTFVDPSLWQAAIAGPHSVLSKRTATDKALEKKVAAALKDDGLADAHVTVNADAKSGTVALGGAVPVPSWAARATYTATQVQGVKAVQDDIFVDLVPPNVSTAKNCIAPGRMTCD